MVRFLDSIELFGASQKIFISSSIRFLEIFIFTLVGIFFEVEVRVITKVHSAGILGVEAYPLEVEVDICLQSFPKWHTVGLAESEVKESKERVVAAIKNSGYDFTQRKVTINLAPADVKKEGTAFDLPIALGLLASSGIIQSGRLQDFLCVGELSLNGELRSVRGVLPMALMAVEQKIKGFLVPAASAAEAAVIRKIPVYAVKNLAEAVEFIEGRLHLEPAQPIEATNFPVTNSGDFDEICGQYQAKRALEVAASGGHNLLFMGSPGAGKTMLASRLPSILPSLTFEESLETTRIYSVLDSPERKGALMHERPFRSPHHSISDAGLVGGGTYPKPGEISLAHNGVLFLDELPEFKKNVLELLRQPLESARVTISRAAVSLTYPAKFMLVAAMNPCPCGYYGHGRVMCTCNPSQIHKYRTKLSGPLLDRIDIQLEVPPVSFDDMSAPDPRREKSIDIATRVKKVREFQRKRFCADRILLNSQMGPKLVKKHCSLKEEGRQIMKSLMEKFHLSARAFDRILKVSRTIADMEEVPTIETKHLLEAVQYRSLDRALV